MKVIPGPQGHRSVFVPGRTPSFIIKEASTLPRRIGIFGSRSLDLDTFYAPDGNKTLVMINKEVSAKSPKSLQYSSCASLAQLPSDTHCAVVGWNMRRVFLGQEIAGICYHAKQDLYVVCSNASSQTRLPDDEEGDSQERSKDGMLLDSRINTVCSTKNM